MPTLEITNLGGPLTRRNTGDINSGLAKHDTSWGYDPYSKPGNLTWFQQPTSILTTGPVTSSIAGIINMLGRDEGGVPKVYATTGDRNLYSMTVFNNSTPNLDSSSIIGSITGTPLYHVGMAAYGSTEKLFIGTNNQIERVNFDGSSPSVITTSATIAINVPRPMAVFQGKIYFGNNNNIGEIDSTETLVTANKLSPALPAGFIVSDLDVTPDGNYLQILASKVVAPIVAGPSFNVSASRAVNNSYKFYWNGIDTAVTAFEQYNNQSLFANEVSGDFSYSLGRDIQGGVILEKRNKVAIPEMREVNVAATYTVGDNLGFGVAEYEKSSGKYKGSLFHLGKLNEETPAGLYRLLRQTASNGQDVKMVQAVLPVSNSGYAIASGGFSQNVSSVGKVYISTLEDLGQVRTEKLWRFSLFSGLTGSVLAGVYETQNQPFSKKVSLGEVRLYTEPLVADNAFTLAILNSGSSVIAQKTYTVGSNVTAGEDLIRFKPEIAPTQAVGLRITNVGTKNWTGLKAEVDWEYAGT